MPIKTAPFDAADYLKSKASIAIYLDEVLKDDDPVFFQKALGTVARAFGMHQIAEMTGTTRAGLYKALASDGNPAFATVQRVVGALGYRLAVVGKSAPRKARAPRAVGAPQAAHVKRKAQGARKPAGSRVRS